MKDRPLVSVIIPTYNYGRFICEAIDSVLHSNFDSKKVEIIVINDGSTDNTFEKIKQYEGKIKYICQPNSGKAQATQVGIEAATGKYLFNLDADDLFLPNKISEVIDIFERDREIVHVAHPTIYWHTNDNTKDIEPIPTTIMGRKLWGRDLLSYLYKRNKLFGGGSTFAARTEVLKKLTIPPAAKLFVDEYLVLFALNTGHSFIIDRPLSLYRIHGNNDSHNQLRADIIKAQRDVKCQETILIDVLQSDFQPEIKKLYTLKTKIAQLGIKEQLNQKSISEVLDLWVYVFSNMAVFKQDILRIIIAYTIVNKSLPRSAIALLKQAIATLHNNRSVRS